MKKEEFENLVEWVEKNTDATQRMENGGKEIYEALQNNPEFKHSSEYKKYMKKIFLLNMHETEQDYKNKVEVTQFNIFTALHKPTDERRLHSRFISYLLSPTSNHGMNKRFLELFVSTLKSSDSANLFIDEEFLKDFINDNVRVLPNENDKSEHENIDILIWNEQSKKAIIIENKIFAGDSNHTVNGQPKPQLIRYFETIQKELILNDEEARTNIKLVYLKLNKKPPSLWQHFRNCALSCCRIEYRTEIRNWLEDCIKEVEKENKLLLRDGIQQYFNLTKQITNDVDKAIALKDMIGNEWEIAFSVFTMDEFKNKYPLTYEEFKHVKWHTVHEFFTELAKRLEAELPETFNEDVTKVTHKETGATTKLILPFRRNNTDLQIVNDTKGFTLGNLKKRTWDYFSDKISNIRFCDFSNEETFHVIDFFYQQDIIDEIVKEIDKIYDKVDKPFKS